MLRFDLLRTILCFALLLVPVHRTSGQTTAPATQPRSAVPTPAALADAEKTVADVYAQRLASKSPAVVKPLLAELLRQSGADSGNNESERYYLLQVARHKAEASGDVANVIAAVDELDRQFNVDAIGLRLESAGKLMTAMAAPADVFEMNLQTALRAMREEKPEFASKAVNAITPERLSGGDAVRKMSARVAEVRTDVAETLEFRRAETTLKDKPVDFASNQTVGWHYAVKRDDWARGLPYLAKAGETALRILAESELRNPTDPNQQAKLGDDWWDRSASTKSLTNADVDVLRKHAAAWYRLALPQLTGLRQARVQSRLAGVDAASAPPVVATVQTVVKTSSVRNGNVVDLLPLVDVDRDSVFGNWKCDPDGLAASSEAITKVIRLPYRPPEEYDFTVEFTIDKVIEWGDVSQFFVAGHRSGGWAVAGNRNTQCGFLDSGPWISHVVEPNTKHRSTVHVRRDTTTATLDDDVTHSLPTHASTQRGDFDAPWHAGLETLGLGAWSQVHFTRISVTEISGPGTIVRRLPAKLVGASEMPVAAHVASERSLLDFDAVSRQLRFAVLWKGISWLNEPPVAIEGKACTDFIATQTPANLLYDIPEGAVGFAAVGTSWAQQVDPTTRFMGYVDGSEVFITKPIPGPGGQAGIRVPLPAGAKQLELRISSAGNFNTDHAVWANPRFLIGDGAPAQVSTRPQTPPIQPAPADFKSGQEGVDLFSKVNAVRDAVSGRWNITQRGIAAGAIMPVPKVLKFNFNPPVEYDYRVRVGRPALRFKGEFALIAIVNGRHFAFSTSPVDGDKARFGFRGADQRDVFKSKTLSELNGILGNKGQVELLLRVRRDFVTAFANGTQVARCATPDFTTDLPNGFDVPPGTIGVLTSQSFGQLFQAEIVTGKLDNAKPPAPADPQPPGDGKVKSIFD